MWPDILYGQELPPTPPVEPATFQTEYHLRNQLYGGAEILRQYAGLPPGVPVPWAVQQTCFFDVPDPRWEDIAPGPNMFMAVNRFVADQMLARGASRAEPIGFLYFYAREIYRRRHPTLPEPQRKGTLVFPDKSTAKRDMIYDRAAFARTLAALPDEYQPVCVSIHWRDWQRGHHSPFVDAGLRAFCSGHSFDPEFHLRQHDLCRQFRYACSNDLSTSFCVAVLSGCHYFHLPSGWLAIHERGSAEALRFDSDPTLRDATRRECIAVAPFPPQARHLGSQRQLAERFTGAAHVREPEVIRALWEEGRGRLRSSHDVPELDFGKVPNCQHLARWLLLGFYADGWVSRRFGLEVPSRPGLSGAAMEIEFPFKTEHPVTLAITPDNDTLRAREVVLPRGVTTLAFACGLGSRPRELLFECSHDFAIGDGRNAALRIRRMRGCEVLPADPVL